MGFPVTYASALPKLFLSAAISVVALKEICCSFLQSLGFCREQQDDAAAASPAALWTFDPLSEADFYSTMVLLRQQQQQHSHTASSIICAIQASLPSLAFHPHLSHQQQHLHHQKGVSLRDGTHQRASFGNDCDSLRASCRHCPPQCPSSGSNSATLCDRCQHGNASNAPTSIRNTCCAQCHNGRTADASDGHSVTSAHDNLNPERNSPNDLCAHGIGHDFLASSHVSSVHECQSDSHLQNYDMSQCHGTNGHGLLHNNDATYPLLCHDSNKYVQEHHPRNGRDQLGDNYAVCAHCCHGGSHSRNIPRSHHSNGTKPAHDNDDVGMPQCAVCLSELREGQDVRQLPLCCHLFHTECIDGWLYHNQRTCPLCRASLISDKVAKQLERLQEEEISQEFTSWFSSYQEDEGGYHDPLFFLPTPLASYHTQFQV